MASAKRWLTVELILVWIDRDVRQKNEGNFVFSWDEEGTPGSIVLEVSLPKHLDSSLIDVDVHPAYVSVVVKGKVVAILHTTKILNTVHLFSDGVLAVASPCGSGRSEVE